MQIARATSHWRLMSGNQLVTRLWITEELDIGTVSTVQCTWSVRGSQAVVSVYAGSGDGVCSLFHGGEYTTSC